ncbi:MAG TPA: porin family protein [Cyclobacteriaceae bacterium]|nr:porin family protein [Cyclobacteriaceae bacterium]
MNVLKQKHLRWPRVLFIFIASQIYIPAKSQVLISLVLGDKLNSGKVEFGLDRGLNLSDQSGLKQSDLLSSFNLGFYFDIKLKKEPWMIHTGVIVKSNMGAGNLPVYSLGQSDLDNTFAGGSVDRKLNYFNVPILLKYNFRNHFYAEAGPQLGLLYKAYDEFTNTVQGNEVTYRREIRDEFHRLDAGMTAGIGYRLMKGNGMNLGVRYYYGLVDVVIDNTGSPMANRSLYVVIGIPIGVGKARERESNEKAN